MVAAGLGIPHKLLFSLMFKNSSSMWLACPTKGFAFLSMRPCTGHFLSLSYSPSPLYLHRDGRAGLEGAWCAGCLGKLGGLCVLAQCDGMYGFRGIHLLGTCSRHALLNGCGVKSLRLLSGWKFGNEFLSAESSFFLCSAIVFIPIKGK